MKGKRNVGGLVQRERNGVKGEEGYGGFVLTEAREVKRVRGSGEHDGISLVLYEYVVYRQGPDEDEVPPARESLLVVSGRRGGGLGRGWRLGVGGGCGRGAGGERGAGVLQRI